MDTAKPEQGAGLQMKTFIGIVWLLVVGLLTLVAIGVATPEKGVLTSPPAPAISASGVDMDGSTTGTQESTQAETPAGATQSGQGEDTEATTGTEQDGQ